VIGTRSNGFIQIALFAWLSRCCGQSVRLPDDFNSRCRRRSVEVLKQQKPHSGRTRFLHFHADDGRLQARIWRPGVTPDRIDDVTSVEVKHEIDPNTDATPAPTLGGQETAATRLDRRGSGGARAALHQKSRGFRAARTGHATDLENRSRGFPSLYHDRRQGE
jgi:hypothetical protein